MTPDKSILASYLAQTSISYEFCTEAAARFFAEWWNGSHVNKVRAQGKAAFLFGNNQRVFEIFACAAEAFNAAAEYAVEIAEGGK